MPFMFPGGNTGGGGDGGTGNYGDLTNKPQINGVTLSGNKSLSDLGALGVGDIPTVNNAELTNTLSYPFNNSQATIALSPAKQSTDYAVLTEANDINGAVGNILISDKQNNGFKMAYTGSATSASINYIVLGGDE
ncbi:hypothetical protein FACS189490_11620 [Clostridia bacterium]|nr:hypothetical protein FACS189490_11620 [Clostridia bacterium]